MYKAVKDVKVVSDYKLYLKFENGIEKIFDMEPYLEYGIFKKLKDKKTFGTVRVCFDSIEWENSADIDPELLYEKGIEIERFLKEK